MDRRKVGNVGQVISAYDIVFRGGRENGKEAILVKVGKIEALFDKSNALDISWLKYKGENLSFLSKNGLNSNDGDFACRFDGGFLYTCGTDNVSACVDGKPVHGSLHYTPAEQVGYEVFTDRVEVFGIVRRTSLFGEHVVVKRRFSVRENEIEISDTISNAGYTPTDYVLLYHMNYGYPFLDENLIIEMPLIKSEGLTDYAKSRADRQFSITEPIDGGEEEVFYNYIKEGRVSLINERLRVKCETLYRVDDFPVTLQWKSMISGDYALGIEPSLTRFDDFRTIKLAAGQKKTYSLKVKIEDYD